MTIPTVSPAILRYLAAFDSIAVVLTRRGSIIAVPNPTGYEAAWWLKKAHAQRLLDEARERGDVELSAKRLGLTVTPHEIAIMRAPRALARLDALMRRARWHEDVQSNLP